MSNILAFHIIFWFVVAVALASLIEKQSPKMNKFTVIILAISWPPIFFVVGIVIFFVTILGHSRVIAGDDTKK